MKEQLNTGPFTTCSALAALSLIGSLAIAQPLFQTPDKQLPSPDELVQAELISGTTALAPGREATLAVAFHIENGWHLYWANPGDTGMAPIINIQAPPGVEIGPIQWPTPRRLLHSGDTLDYIYEHDVALLIPVRIAPGAAPGDVLTFHAHVEWLVCHEACIPGESDLELRLPVVSPSAPLKSTPDATRIERSIARLAKKPTPEQASTFQSRWEGATLEIISPGADELIYYPLAPDGLQPANIADAGRTKGSTMRIKYRTNIFDAERVTGVLERREGGVTHFYLLEWPAPEAG